MKFKTPLTKKVLYVGTTILFVLSPALLFLFAQNVFLSLTSLSYIFLLLALFFIVSPFGKIKLAKSPPDTPAMSTSHWLSKIFLAEIILYLLFLSFTHVTSQYMPLPFTTPSVFTGSLHPWPMFAVLSVILGYQYYVKNHLPIFAAELPTLLLQRWLQILLVISTSFILLLTVALLGFQIALLISDTGSIPRATGLQGITILAGISALAWLQSKQGQSVIHFLCRKQFSLGKFYLLLAIVLGLLLTLINLCAPLTELFSFLNVTQWHFTPTETEWRLVTWGWWLGWATLAVTYFVKISYGRAVREVVLAVVLLSIVVFCIEHMLQRLFTDTLFLNVIALLGPCAFIMLCWREHTSHYFLLGFMPYEENNTITIPRRLIKFIKPMLQGILLLAMIYLWLGFVPLGLGILLATFTPFGVFLFLAIVFTFKNVGFVALTPFIRR